MAYWNGTAWVPDTPVTAPLHRSYRTRLLGAGAEALLIVLLTFGLVAGTALAAKGGNGGGKGGGKPKPTGTSTVTLLMVDDTNGNGLPNWGDTITFDVSTTATANPYLSVRCYQGSVLVYGADAGFYPEYPWPGARLMPLWSPSWTGGAADCTAVLNDGLATVSFHVDA